MDPVILIGQKNTLVEYMILSGADNHPPLLDKDLVAKDLWERMQLLMQVNQQTHLAEFPQIDSGLAFPVFKQGDDPIDAINKMMSFLSIGRQTSFAVGMSGTRANISRMGGNNSGQQRVVKRFNCQGEGHMARQCPKPKRKRDATWFRDKVLLIKAQGNGKVLNEEELEFLAGPGVVEGLVTQTVITHNAAYQADDLDAYDSDCDDFSTAKAILMANCLVTDQMFSLRFKCSTPGKGMYKLDPVTLAPRDKNNRETHIYYLKHTMEQADILREIVEQAKLLNPLNIASYSACKITATNKVPLREPIPLKVVAQESVVTKVYTKRPKVVQVVLSYLDSGCSKHMTRDRSQLTNFVHKFLDTVKFVPVANAPRAVDLADSPVSTSIDQDAPNKDPSRSVSTRKKL
nr:retrovirus-related Pol polyprotein from transposon TNT 1-94 [Tanacetum cinerariifolium]